MMFRPFLLAILIIFNVFSANATEQHNITDYVDKIVTQFTAIANNSTLNNAAKIERVKPLLSENLDINWMSQFSLGRHKKDLTSEQKASFTEIYKDYIIASYASSIKQYRGQQVKIIKVQNIAENEYVVKTSIMKTGQDPFLVDYLVRSYPNGTYKVFDVVTESISMITSQQAEFANVILTNGLKTLEDNLISKTKSFDQQSEK